MTSSEAAQILQRPLFGNAVCIDAIQVLQMAEELLAARKWARRRGLFTSGMKTDAVAFMQHEDVEDELSYWSECGWGKA